MTTNFQALDFRFFLGDVTCGIGFRPFWQRLLGRGPQPQERNNFAQVFSGN